MNAQFDMIWGTTNKRAPSRRFSPFSGFGVLERSMGLGSHPELLPNELKAIRKARPALCFIFHGRHDSKCLAEILLMQTFDSDPICFSVKTLHHAKWGVSAQVDTHLRNNEPHGLANVMEKTSLGTVSAYSGMGVFKM